jgi:hypothetical protein
VDFAFQNEDSSSFYRISIHTAVKIALTPGLSPKFGRGEKAFSCERVNGCS